MRACTRHDASAGTTVLRLALQLCLRISVDATYDARYAGAHADSAADRQPNTCLFQLPAELAGWSCGLLVVRMEPGVCGCFNSFSSMVFRWGGVVMMASTDTRVGQGCTSMSSYGRNDASFWVGGCG